MVVLDVDGAVVVDGRTLGGVRWRVLRGRYRFEGHQQPPAPR